LTVDVEDYFHVNAFREQVSREEWEGYPSRVVANTETVLELLEEHEARATFFVLGWVAEKYPGLVRAIHSRGHEVACHGYGHELVFEIGPARFREDLRRSRDLIEDICGERVKGYRAPSFSITGDSLWALDIIIEEGFLYDSSIFPIIHDTYGLRDAPPFLHRVDRPAGTIAEFPPSTIEIGFLGKTHRMPFSGGGYLRLLPTWFVERAINHTNGARGEPSAVYFHPWEIDPGQPRIRSGLRSRFRHYHNLQKTKGKIGRLLSAFSFAPMSEVIGNSAAAGGEEDAAEAGTPLMTESR
jgi:polysaccharide deacetylase family protein (PEP-CTERM system associated)